MYRFTRVSAILVAVVSFVLIGADGVSGQLRLPRPSSNGSVMQTIGVTDVTIKYSRPGVKGRKIWGDAVADAKGEATLDNQNTRPAGAPIVPFGHIWRTGANEATQFTVTDDVLINGQPLAAGSYSLHTIPGKDEWTIVFNDTENQWGSFNYDQTKDKLRVKAKPQAAEHQEWLAFEIEPTADNAAQVNIRWEKVSVPFTVEVKDQNGLILKKAAVAVAAAKPDDWQTPLSAANFAKRNNAAADAGKWYGQALSAIDEQLKAKPNFQNTAQKASILIAAGRSKEAIPVAEKAVELGKAEKADTSALEKRLADLKAGKQ
ncbi:MAG: DUF2911 domain-containing protein [Acidobacteria bacterium]|nr:DUF2911 domain-containing protein [Acidobacteriota bacterium]